MAAMKEPSFFPELKRTLLRELRESGLSARISWEPVPGTKLCRVVVRAGGFKGLPFTERQDLVGRIARTVLRPDQQLRISMIVTLTPEELCEVAPAPPASARRTKRAV